MGPTYLGALATCNGGYNNMGQCISVSDMYSANNLTLYQSAPQQEAIDQFYATQVAYLAQKLNGISGANGGSLLDQSVLTDLLQLHCGSRLGKASALRERKLKSACIVIGTRIEPLHS